MMDINCDLGEGIGNDAKIMPYLGSCNIACGVHAGDEQMMRKTVKLAKKYGVKIGAHPSLPGKENFGREVIMLPEKELKTLILDQILALKSIVAAENAVLHHIKPHGALYNMAARDEAISLIIIEVLKEIGGNIKLYVPYNSVIAKLSQAHKIPYFYEVFADRAYSDDLTLVSRKLPGALIEDPETVFKRALQMKTDKSVITITGKKKHILADTVCVHGDHPKAVEIARLLSKLK